jgi:hypothetical protein
MLGNSIITYFKKIALYKIPLYYIPTSYSFYYIPRETFMIGTFFWLINSLNEETERRQKEGIKKINDEPSDDEDEPSDDDDETIDTQFSDPETYGLADENTIDTVESDNSLNDKEEYIEVHPQGWWFFKQASKNKND